jgi:hypothetical protein
VMISKLVIIFLLFWSAALFADEPNRDDVYSANGDTPIRFVSCSLPLPGEPWKCEVISRYSEMETCERAKALFRSYCNWKDIYSEMTCSYGGSKSNFVSRRSRQYCLPGQKNDVANK